MFWGSAGVLKSPLAITLSLLSAVASMCCGRAAQAQIFLEPSLKTASRPEPTTLDEYIADRDAAIRLGKALFWDIRLGSDGQTACATCHHQAGADSRVKNIAHPGADGLFTPGCTPGANIPAAMFPTTRFQDPADRFSTRTMSIDDVAGSPGVLKAAFMGLDANGNEICQPLDETTFVADGVAHRQVTGRNSPSVINSVFNVRQFWDGRANAWFNGANPFGPVDPTASVWRIDPDTDLPVQVQVHIDHASLASQAVGPVNNEVEMAAHGRGWVDAAKKLLDDRALLAQTVSPTDSVLGPFANSAGGIVLTYNQMIQDAFLPEWWEGGNIAPGVSQMEANLALFFGLAVQLYETTLVSDDTRYDQWIEQNGPMGDARHLMSEQELRGLRMFFNLDPTLPATNCRECHISTLFTVATYAGKVGGMVQAGIGAFPPGTPDTDGDKFPDITDAFPLDPTEWIDTDGDGIGNNADPDDDNDGIPDIIDPLPLEADPAPPPPPGIQFGPMPLAFMPDLAAALLASKTYEEPPLGIEPHVLPLDFALTGGPIEIFDAKGNLLATIPLAARSGIPCTFDSAVITQVPSLGQFAHVDTAVNVVDCRMTMNIAIIGFPLGDYPFKIDGIWRGTLVSARDVVYDEGFYNIGVRPPGEDPGVNGLHPNGTPLSAARRALIDPNLTEFGPMPNMVGSLIRVDNAFKTPGLRNIELTGPFFHNGGAATLEDVIRFYNRGGDFHLENLDSIAPAMLSLGLSEPQIADLAAFLRTLTDERVRSESAPFDHPELPLPGAPTLPAVGETGRTPVQHLVRSFEQNVGDSDGDGVIGQFDNCPDLANPGQENADGDMLGNACDGDDDGDGFADASDAYPLVASKWAIDAVFSAAEISAMLSNPVLMAVDATGMDAPQLVAVANGSGRVTEITGTFTLTAALSLAQLEAILDLAVPPTAAGGAVITVDATGMDLQRLGALATNGAVISGIRGLTLTSQHNALLISMLVAKTLPDGATIVATGMTESQLAAAVSGTNRVVITGMIRVHGGMPAAFLAELATQLGASATLHADTTGMSAAQQAALVSGASLIVDCDQAVGTGELFTVYIDLGNLPVRAVGLQARVEFDPSLLEFVPDAAGVGGTEFPQTIHLTSTAGSVTFSTGVDIVGSGEGVLTGNAARLTFRALGAICGATDLVRLATSGFLNRISSESAPGVPSSPIPFSVVNLMNVTALSTVGISGDPAQPVRVPVDAGTTLGAALPMPAVVASNGCGAVPVSMLVQFPASAGGGITETWPGHFPVGVTTVTWTATAATGHSLSRSQTYEVLDHQLMTVDIDLIGGMSPTLAYTLPMRVRLDSGVTLTQPIEFAGANGAMVDMQVPVASNYGCVSVKSPTHTLASSAGVSIVGTKYAVSAPIALTSGDSNDDNMVDILDFGIFMGDRGPGKNALSRSNFDHNPVVSNSDFSFITLNFLRIGTECGGNLTGRQPLERASVKDLRRHGLGQLANADLNGDGWVDPTDMALYMQGAAQDHDVVPGGAHRVKDPRW